MGRAFEYRKARKLKRWGHMARTFTKIGKEIELAVIAGGPDPSSNLRLRLLMATAKSESMPKENVERAIKRATEKDKSAYKEVVYDGKGPHGTAFVVETATDNPTRTVANIRAAFVRGKGELGTMGMNDFLFERKCSFVVAYKEGTDMDELELDLCDYDIDEVFLDEGEIFSPTSRITVPSPSISKTMTSKSSPLSSSAYLSPCVSSPPRNRKMSTASSNASKTTTMS